LQTNPGGLHAYAAQPGLKLSLQLWKLPSSVTEKWESY
jgi:hypothetical protein